MQNPSIKCFPPVLQHKLERRFCRGGFIKYSDGGRVSLSSVIARFEKEAIQQNKWVSLPLVPLFVVKYKKILEDMYINKIFQLWYTTAGRSCCWSQKQLFAWAIQYWTMNIPSHLIFVTFETLGYLTLYQRNRNNSLLEQYNPAFLPNSISVDGSCRNVEIFTQPAKSRCRIKFYRKVWQVLNKQSRNAIWKEALNKSSIIVIPII